MRRDNNNIVILSEERAYDVVEIHLYPPLSRRTREILRRVCSDYCQTYRLRK